MIREIGIRTTHIVNVTWILKIYAFVCKLWAYWELLIYQHKMFLRKWLHKMFLKGYYSILSFNTHLCSAPFKTFQGYTTLAIICIWYLLLMRWIQRAFPHVSLIHFTHLYQNVHGIHGKPVTKIRKSIAHGACVCGNHSANLSDKSPQNICLLAVPLHYIDGLLKIYLYIKAYGNSLYSLMARVCLR